MCALAGTMLSTVAPAQARSDEELRNRQHDVSRQIDKSRGHLAEVSQQLLDATAALRSAEQQLADARGELAAAQARVAVAEAEDERMQQRLAAAEQRLTRSRKALAEGAKEVARQRSSVAELAVEQYQGENSQLLNLSAALSAKSPNDLSSQMAAVGDVLDQGAASLDGLEATRVLLRVQEQEVQKAKKQVADRRADAAALLARTERARAQAAQAESAVTVIVQQMRQARIEAQRAVSKERHRLAELRQERNRVSQILAVRAARAARRHQAELTAFSGKSNGFLSYPVNGPVTSSYGMRMHPILHILKLHDGTDFSAACGTPIHSAAAGTVIERSYDGGYGNRLIVADGFHQGVSLSTAYNHLSSYRVDVGERVKRGEVLGYVGSTGYSTGCHLHFMVYENGVTVDPMSWL